VHVCKIEHVRAGKHGARSTEQATAIGLSKARRAGVKLEPPRKGRAPKGTRKQAQKSLEKGKRQACGQAVTCSQASAEAGGPQRGQPAGAVETRAQGGAQTHSQ
jgi:hypothetical protein